MITAGTFHQIDGKVFWNVHDPEKAIAVDLRDEDFSSLVIEVPDPDASMLEIDRAIAGINV